MFKQLSIAAFLEDIYKGWFDATGDLPGRVEFLAEMRKAAPYVMWRR